MVISQDEGIRADTTFAGLSKLKPAFKEGGSTTAGIFFHPFLLTCQYLPLIKGNSSQLSDGAAAALLMKRSTAEKLKLPVLGVFRSFSAVGVEPYVMGVGPAYPFLIYSLIRIFVNS